MSKTNTAAQADSLLSVLKATLSAEGLQAFSHVVLYTSFGVVRGRTGLSLSQGLVKHEEGVSTGQGMANEVLELYDATVEHYSNHLPTGSFDRLYVRLGDVQGFAFESMQGQ